MRALLPLWLAACAPAGPRVGACEPARPGDPPPADAVALAALLAEVQAALFPSLDGVDVALVELDSETDYFQANLDLSTASSPPLERAYRVLHEPRLFEDPPPQPAIAAILAHELAHVADYTELDAEALIRFGLWYATADTAAYERETDEVALWLGCADGLKAYRLWLYDHVPADALAEKQRVYYTPDEIDAWVAANGG